MARCTDTTVRINDKKVRWSDVSVWAKDHRGELKRVRHWKDVRDLELAALADGSVWSHRVIALEAGAGREEALSRWNDSRVASYLDDRSARGKKPAVPQGIDAEFLKDVDIIGDLHGCAMTLRELADQLGYDERWEHPQGRRIVFLGDFADKNLVRGHNLHTVRQVCALLVTGKAVAVMGNHDRKLLRAIKAVMEAEKAHNKRVREPVFRELPKLSEHVLAALRHTNASGDTLSTALRAAAGWMRQSSPKYGIDLTLREISQAHDALDVCKMIVQVYGSLSHQMSLSGGTVIAVHAATRSDLIGATTRKARDLALFGDVTGRLDEEGYPVRRDWTKEWSDERTVVYGHEIQEGGARVSGSHGTAIGIDTGAYEAGDAEGFRGLTALRWPERELVSVETHAMDLLHGEERERVQLAALAASSTAREMREVEAPGLNAARVRVIADDLAAMGKSGWVTGLDAVVVSRGGAPCEIQVCADGDEIAGMLARHGATRLGESFLLEDGEETLRVRAVGASIDAHIAASALCTGAMVSVWGDGHISGEEVSLSAPARMVVREQPEVILEAIAASSLSRAPLARDFAFAIKANKQLELDRDDVAFMLQRMNGIDGPELGRFLAACGSLGVLGVMFSKEVGVLEVRALAGEARAEKRWETLQSWMS
jgi:protein phosphatase